ncbi:sigma-70 family RNA polymerase sigma factor [Dehalococcoidia bacterium]|nr:sigma-70 family RNA polymerase sigma factor [Dehalococcoidia bacterium]
MTDGKLQETAVLEDNFLLSEVAKGDPDAFSELYDRFAERVFRYALTLLRDRQLAEEVAQETMVCVWQGAGKFSGRSQVSTWIFGIARKQAHNLLRQETKCKRLFPEATTLPDPADVVESKYQVLGAVEALPPEQREIVFLTFYAGLPYREIANLLDVPEGTVKSRMYYAKRKLAEMLR